VGIREGNGVGDKVPGSIVMGCCGWRERICVARACSKYVVFGSVVNFGRPTRSSSGVGIVIRLHSSVYWAGWEGRSHEL